MGLEQKDAHLDVKKASLMRALSLLARALRERSLPARLAELNPAARTFGAPRAWLQQSGRCDAAKPAAPAAQLCTRSLWTAFASRCQTQQPARDLMARPHAGFTARAGVHTASLSMPQQLSQAQQCQSLAAGLSASARRSVAIWLGGCSAWVFSMVVLGGATRLTRSGLSMTDWKFTGEWPPTDQETWLAEFAKYQRSPEFQRVNRSITLDEFKFIYWMEYAHRMWGRVLGLAFAGPALYFAARGYINRPLARRLGLLFLLGGTQGLVGWWMVRSGLQEPELAHQTPRVSPYRLAAHLGSAFAIYSLLLWTTLSVALPESAAMRAATDAAARASAGLRKWTLPLAGLIAVTGLSGAFVAGMDAGHAYNTFPLMGGRLVPAEYWDVPGWRNAFENTAAVQFHHRVLAATTLGSVLATWLAHRQAPLPRPAKLLLHGLLAVTATQVALGITTLLTYVPPSLGTAHQATALTLFSVALGLLHVTRPPHTQPSALLRAATPVTAAAALLIALAVSNTE